MRAKRDSVSRFALLAVNLNQFVIQERCTSNLALVIFRQFRVIQTTANDSRCNWLCLDPKQTHAGKEADGEE